ncbi:uncharacterized protein Tco025E_06399 [Trypanosoma conorhini]|uniref:Uncharacterized protein n=1 Tax=Trypanosoma conorhini TaxID=83891 RepID=A0A3R7MCS5_9TRYP|nr:uncharacterized protein Tco025E_06399 [Trypanosoma conorhini]RNF12953.1 hypothetical protein Tco025E_06399 [Trypanosoma conorhini]
MMRDEAPSSRSSERGRQQREFEDIQHSMQRIEKLLHRGQRLLYEEDGKAPAHGAAGRGGAARRGGERGPTAPPGKPQRFGPTRQPAAQVARGPAPKERQHRAVTTTTAPARQRERVADAGPGTGPAVRRRAAEPRGQAARHPTSHPHGASMHEEADSSDEFEDISIPELRERIRRELEAYRLNRRPPPAWPASADSPPQKVKRLSAPHDEAAQGASVKMTPPQATPLRRPRAGGAAATGPPARAAHNSRNSPLHAERRISAWKRLYGDAQRLQGKLQQPAAKSSVGEFGASFKAAPGERASLMKRFSLRNSMTAASSPAKLQTRVGQQAGLNGSHQRQGVYSPALAGRFRNPSENREARNVSAQVVVHRRPKAERNGKKQKEKGAAQESHRDPWEHAGKFGAAVARETTKDAKELEAVDSAEGACKPGLASSEALDTKTPSNHEQQSATGPPLTALTQGLELAPQASSDSPPAQRSKESSPMARAPVPPVVRPLDLRALRK